MSLLRTPAYRARLAQTPTPAASIYPHLSHSCPSNNYPTPAPLMPLYYLPPSCPSNIYDTYSTFALSIFVLSTLALSTLAMSRHQQDVETIVPFIGRRPLQIHDHLHRRSAFAHGHGHQFPSGNAAPLLIY